MTDGPYTSTASRPIQEPAEEQHDPCSEGLLRAFMQGYQRADLASVNQLIDCLAPRLIRFFERQVHDRTRAEDLVQDCWMRVHKSRHTYRPGSPLLPWVYAIARRTGIDGYRRARRSLAFEQEFDEGSSDAASPRGLSPETKIGLQQELASLSIKERQAIELLKVEGLSLEDVASMTGASVNAVKQRAHRAYLKLRKSLGGPK